MANININEISQNYTYNIGNSSYASVALPITACWGPGYTPQDQDKVTEFDEDTLESVVWNRFPATQAGLESFISTYRGPVSNYRSLGDNSYQVAMTLLTSGYEVITCRVAAGQKASGTLYFHNKTKNEAGTGYEEVADVPQSEISEDLKQLEKLSVKYMRIKAKYTGTFGNKLRVLLQYNSNYNRWNFVTYIVDESGIQTAIENKSFVFNMDNSTDTLPHISELESNFIEVESCNVLDDEVFVGVLTKEEVDGEIKEVYKFGTEYSSADVFLAGGEDWISNAFIPPASSEGEIETESEISVLDYAEGDILKSIELAKFRYEYTAPDVVDVFDIDGVSANDYTRALKDAIDSGEISADSSYFGQLVKLYEDLHDEENPIEEDSIDLQMYNKIYFKQWIYTSAFQILDTLEDKLTYNMQRLMMPGWDDQNFLEINEDWDPIEDTNNVGYWQTISPLHGKMMEVAYFSRCATAYLDIPKSLKRQFVYNESEDDSLIGYAQRLARFTPSGFNLNLNIGYFSSHSALFAPWGKYTYAGTSKQSEACPSFLSLMIERAMILNQPSQYEWLLPSNRKHSLKIGKLDYNISKKYLDMWQKLEGVGVNCITDIPDMGVSIWGNSTLYEVPPATYQALANLSTRKLVNAVEDLVYRCGISITFQYNNDQAYNSFYAGMTPLLDTMRNQGAIVDYYIRMSEDIDGLDQINANSVVGKIYLTVNGVVNDIDVDLIALPPNVDLDQYRI